MRLIALSMENFLPFKGVSRIDFPQDPFRNVMVIFGDNMRGKTSFLNAIRWAFYGRAVGRHLREIPLQDLLNREAADEGEYFFEVGITFEANGHRYDLRRRATKRAIVARPQRPDDFEVIVGLQRDGLAMPGGSIDSEINRYAPEQVSRFFLFDGELLQDYEALLIEGSEQGRQIKEAIEQVLGVPTLIQGREEAATLLKSFQRQQAKDASHISGLEMQAQRQQQLQVQQENLESDLRSLEEKLAETRSEREKLDDELDAVESVFASKVKLDQLESRQKELDIRISDRTLEKGRLLSMAWRDLLQPRLRIRKAALYAEQERVTKEMSERARKEERAKALQKIFDQAICPTCGQEADPARRDEAASELGVLQVELANSRIDTNSLVVINGMIRQIDGIQAVGVRAQYEALRRDLSQSSIELTRCEGQIEKLKDEIRGYDTAEIARKRSLRDGLVREEAKVGEDINNRRAGIEKIRSELATISKLLQSSPLARASRSAALVDACMAAERVFAGAIDRLRENLKREVEEKATSAFKQLTTQEKYQRLQINQSYGLSIIDERGAKVNVRSAGAEQIVALSLIDGLSRTGRSAGPVVMDTPFGRLDLKHRDNILKYLPTTTGQLILLVHDGEIRRDRDLSSIAERIEKMYEIREVSPRHSRIERVLA